MLIDIIEKISELNENIFSNFDGFIEGLGMADWLADAIIDSFHILPLLFLVFLLIEVIEFFYGEKINNFMKGSEKTAPLVGSMAAILPQCGFSVIASTLYIRRLITKGTLIGIYLATSDEAIPILLAEPNQTKYVIPIVGLKFIIGIVFAYLLDFILKDKKYIEEAHEECHDDCCEEGCCHHSVGRRRKRDLLYHPFWHTLNIFGFILLITILLNFAIEIYSGHAVLHTILGKVRFLEPVFMGILGLIPNCATSIAITMLLIKGSISFGAAMSGLLSNAGLGLLILFRHNKAKDTAQIIGILLVVSIVIGSLIQFLKIGF